MIPEQELVDKVLLTKHPDDRVAIVVPRKEVFYASYRNFLIKTHHVWIVNAGLHGNDEEDCLRTAGVGFNDIYLFQTNPNCYCAQYMFCRHRPSRTRPGKIHFVE